MVMVSLIFAMALAQGLRGLSEIVTSRKGYQPHTMWVWAYWDFNIVDE